MKTVLEQADVCGRAGEHVVSLMTNLCHSRGECRDDRTDKYLDE